VVVLAPLLKQLLGLGDARWVSVHEVYVRLRLGKLVRLGSLHEILQCFGTMDLVQPVPNKLNVVISEVRHEEQIFACSSK
jgi:hypothetical protein